MIRLLVDHIVIEDDAIIIHHIVPITENGRLSLKRNIETNRSTGMVSGLFFASGPRGIRTLDLLNAIEARSQLRYGPMVCLLRAANIVTRLSTVHCPEWT